MPCHKLNRRGHVTRPFHRLWCRSCRNSQHLDTMIGFGLVQMQDEPVSQSGMAQTLAALPLEAGGKAVRRAARRVGLRQCAIAARVGLAGLCAFGTWMAYMNYTPALHIPAKPVLAVNAFDYFKRAGKQMIYSQEIGDAVSMPSKNLKAGPRVHRQESEADPENPATRHPVWRVYEHDHLYTLDDKQFLLDANRDTLATLREGLKQPYMDTYVRSMKTMFPYFAQDRAIARLLSVEAQTRAERGDWSGAMQSSLDSVELGAKLPRGGPLIGRLVGIACEAIGRKQVWKIVSHLDAAQTRAALARMKAIRAQHIPYADTLQEEDWGIQASLREIMDGPNWRMHIFSLMDSDNYGNNRHFDIRGLMIYGWSNRIILKDMADYEREVLRRSRLPYQVSHALPPIPEPVDPMWQIFTPVFEQAHFRDVEESETQDDLLLVTLALHLYALDNKGAYPDTLAQLTPRYLDHIPADLFAHGNTPLRYKRSGARTEIPQPAAKPAEQSGGIYKPQAAGKAKPPYDPDYPGKGVYVLYSVGPDGKDGGGLPIDAALRPANDSEHKTLDSYGRYQVNPGSVGDIVAGLNGP